MTVRRRQGSFFKPWHVLRLPAGLIRAAKHDAAAAVPDFDRLGYAVPVLVCGLRRGAATLTLHHTLISEPNGRLGCLQTIAPVKLTHALSPLQA